MLVTTETLPLEQLRQGHASLRETPDGLPGKGGMLWSILAFDQENHCWLSKATHIAKNERDARTLAEAMGLEVVEVVRWEWTANDLHELTIAPSDDL